RNAGHQPVCIEAYWHIEEKARHHKGAYSRPIIRHESNVTCGTVERECVAFRKSHTVDANPYRSINRPCNRTIISFVAFDELELNACSVACSNLLIEWRRRRAT